MSLDYIQSTYLTFEQLVALSGISAERLRAMIGTGCLPGPAYRATVKCRISSIFGDYDEEAEREYFPRSHVVKAKALEQVGGALVDLAAKEKTAFIAAYAETLEALRADTFGLEALFGADGRMGGLAAEDLLEKEWQAYLEGAYGLCTRTASAEDIATKEAMIAKIKYLTAAIDAGTATDARADLKQAVDLLDQVSALFAPHEVSRSSRGTYINQIRVRYLDQAA